MNDARLEVRIPSDLKHQLSLEAARDNRSMANVVILAIRQYLSKGETK